MSVLKKSIIYSFIGQYIEILITFISSITISRLLTPKEIGIFSVALAITLVAHMIRDFGAGSYIIKTKLLNNVDISAALIVNLITSWLAAAGLYLVSDSASIWLGIPELAFVIKMVSLNFLIIPFGAMRLALIRREMKFKRYMIINSISSFVLASISIFLAYNNYGYLALVYGSICGTLVTVLLAFFLSPSVSFVFPNISALKKVILFGGKLSYISIIETISVPFYEVICSKFFGVATNGLFSKGKGVIQLFNKAIIDGFIPVMLPHFSKISLLSEVNNNYTSLVTSITAICWPLLSIIFVLAEPILTFLFGSQWGGASVYLQWLIAVNCIYILHVFNGQVLTSQGLLNIQVLYKSCGLLIALPLAYYAAIEGSIRYFMMAMLIQIFIELVLASYVLVSKCGIKADELLTRLLNSSLLAVMVFIFTTLIWQSRPENLDEHLWMFLCGVISLLFWMIIGIFFKNQTILAIRSEFFNKLT